MTELCVDRYFVRVISHFSRRTFLMADHCRGGPLSRRTFVVTDFCHVGQEFIRRIIITANVFNGERLPIILIFSGLTRIRLPISPLVNLPFPTSHSLYGQLNTTPASSCIRDVYLVYLCPTHHNISIIFLFSPPATRELGNLACSWF